MKKKKKLNQAGKMKLEKKKEKKRNEEERYVRTNFDARILHAYARFRLRRTTTRFN